MVVVNVLMGLPTVSFCPFGALISLTLQKTYKITKNPAFVHTKTTLKKAKNPYFFVMGGKGVDVRDCVSHYADGAGDV